MRTEFKLIPCTCRCHRSHGVMHIMPCCDKGFKKIPVFYSDNSDGDWVEDGVIEDVNHLNECVVCGNDFFGDKHRVVCKVCAGKNKINK